jgi:two-component system chemotaxis response regulator CheV
MSHDKDIEERTRLAGTNKFELLLFRLGESPGTGERELFGINVFKVREVLVMPKITALANSHEHLMGIANIRGQIIPVINLPAVVGCKPTKGHTILMVTEFARTVQAFAVEDVREIVRLEWDQVLPAESSHAGALVTGIARLDGSRPDTRLAQVLDVEEVLRDVMPVTKEEITREVVGPELLLPAGTSILVADDSHVARSVIELGLKAMGAPFVMTKTGKEAWDYLQDLADHAKAEGFRAEGPHLGGVDRPRNAGNGWFHPDQTGQAGCALQGYSGGHSLIVDRHHQRESRQGGGGGRLRWKVLAKRELAHTLRLVLAQILGK